MIPFENLQYGFRYGAATITRLLSNKKNGWVVIGINTLKNVDLQIYVTRTGKVRIYGKTGEWKSPGNI